jgi:hypothetical protein
MTKSIAQLDLELDRILAEPPPTPSGKTAAQLNREIAEAVSGKADPERVAAYAEKLEGKRERLEERSRKAATEAASRFGAAHRIGSMIPMGQPILVGHHSEGRHRRDLAKIDRSMRKGIEAEDKAAELRGRAAAIGTAGISSDDPEAVKKLKRELNQLRVNQDAMKAGNAAIKKHAKAGPEAQVAALMALGWTEAIARKGLEKDFAGRIGFPAYKITNNGANIRRIEKRIAELVTKETTPARTPIEGSIEGMTFTISENKDANRTQIVFSGKPSEAIRAKLKSGGFRWAPSEGAWQRQISNGAWYQATHALGVA